jgi:hypothetical protein
VPVSINVGAGNLLPIPRLGNQRRSTQQYACRKQTHDFLAVKGGIQEADYAATPGI